MTRQLLPPDPLHHPERYSRLVLALDHAARALRSFDQDDAWNIVEVLTRLLPDIAAALDVEQTFVARLLPGESGRAWVEVLAAHPAAALHGQRLELTGRLRSLVEKGRPRVIDPLGSDSARIAELSLFAARAAILARIHLAGDTYVVGVCNRRNPDEGPFLAADRMAFDYILESLTSAVRAGERRRRELEAIQRVSEAVALGSLQDVYQQIVGEAVAVTGATHAVLWQLNKNRSRLDLVTFARPEEPDWQPAMSSLPLDRVSLNGSVALGQRSQYASAPAASAQFADWEPATQSAYCVPLVFQNLVLGTLFVASQRVDGVGPDDRRFITQLALHAAVALHNARLKNIRQRVIAFQQQTADILPLDQEMEQIREELQQHVDVSGLFIAVFDQQTNRLTFPLVYDQGQRIQESEQRPGRRYSPQPFGQRQGMVEWVLRQRESLLVRDFASDALAQEIDPALRPGVVSCLVAPLISKGEAIGAIALRSYDPATRFDEYDKTFLEPLARHLAVVIANSHLFDATTLELHQRVLELRAVSRFQEKISDLSKSEGEEIQQIYAEATEALRAVNVTTDNLLIALYRDEGRLVEFPLVYERGVMLSAQEKMADAAYCTRRLGARHDIIDWMLTQRQLHLGRTRAEIEAWVATLAGVEVAPQRSCSWLGAPMIAGGELIGVIALRDLDREGVFQERHCELVKTIAGQAAIAIHNARLYAREIARANELNALYAAGRAIHAAGVDRDPVLQAILEQAVSVTGAHFGTLQLKQGDHLEFVAAWPIAERSRLQETYGRMSIHGTGITARVALENHYVLAPDVTQEADYEPGSDTTRSELAVSLRRGGEEDGPCEGVLNVEHEEVGGLGPQHVQSLISLSNLAVVAIQNARQAEELTRSNAIAVMGAWGADLVHDVNKEVANIRRAVQILLDRSDLPPEARPRLEQIDQYAADMALPELPEEPPQLGEAIELRNAPKLDGVLRSELVAYRRRRTGVTIAEELGSGEARVAIHEPWLRRIVRHFINNAIRAMPPERERPGIVIATRVNGEMAEIYITDNGKGVREEIQPYLFKRPILHREPRLPDRPGRGLLLVGYVTKLYGGECKLDWSQPGEGSRFLISIPLAPQRQ